MALPEEPASVEELLNDYWGSHLLTDHGDRCEHCGMYCNREQHTMVQRWPDILAVHCKRWEVVSLHPFHQKKVHTPVSFETVLLASVDQPPYHLRGVIVHAGGAGGGHYTAYVRATDNHWYFCDDFEVPCRVGVDRVLSAEAYMLFYER